MFRNSEHLSAFIQAEESCDHHTLGVTTTHDGDYEVQVLVHTPKVNCHLLYKIR